MAPQPNIVLINVDQWRADCLSIEGHPVVHTPWLDQLALQGARFRRAYAACPSCIAARAALHTGLTQRTHGRVGYQDGVPWNYPVTIASEFTRHGYQTQAIGKMHVFPERAKLGFQNVILHDGFVHFTRRRYPRRVDPVDDYHPWLRRQLGREADDFDHGLNSNSFVARPWDKPEHVHPTNFIATQAVEFLKRRRARRPFFLFLSFHRPHPPLDPPAWAFEQYLTQPMPDPPVGDWAADYAQLVPANAANPHRPDLSQGKLAAPLLQRARAGYYGHMTHIDHQINRFVETLANFGELAKTYICFVSDHGEMLGDHNIFRKCVPYEGSARVPLILTGPPGSGIRPNSIHQPVVELRDVMPTLLDCAGLPVPTCVEGRSFLPIARGVTGSWRDYLHGEHTLFGGSVQWLTDGHEKYVWFSQNGTEQLFDLDRDPQELHSRAGRRSSAKRLAHWRKLLIHELTGREEGFADGQRLIPGRPVVACLSHLLRT